MFPPFFIPRTHTHTHGINIYMYKIHIYPVSSSLLQHSTYYMGIILRWTLLMELHIPPYLNVTMTYFGEKLFRPRLERRRKTKTALCDRTYYRFMCRVIYNNSILWKFAKKVYINFKNKFHTLRLINLIARDLTFAACIVR